MPKKLFRQVRRSVATGLWPVNTNPLCIGRPPGPWLQLVTMLEPSSDESFMREALRMAQKAYDANEVPVGAVVVHEGRIIARACNQVELIKDYTSHAEIMALTNAEVSDCDWVLIE